MWACVIKYENRSHFGGEALANGTYNTAAREAISAFFASNPDRQFTADQIFEETCRILSKKPGKSTVYRLLSRLCEEKFLRKCRDTSNSLILYQMARERSCEEHLHLKCTSCGKVYHLDCGEGCSLVGHLLQEHGFRINSDISMLYGECGICRKG